MSNIYKDYFSTLKKYLTILQIDKDSGLIGCQENEIDKLKQQKGKIPLAYEEYLRSIGKKFLFEFMDAENMAFEDLDYINEFADDVFSSNSLQIEKPFFVISERRYDYISFIYSEEDNPKVWIMSEYWDDEEENNLIVRSESFIDLMNIFFWQTLNYRTAGFHFVSSEIKDTEKYIQNKYFNWSKSLKEVNEIIESYNKENPLINSLNEYFLNYYLDYFKTNENSIDKHFPEKSKKNDLESNQQNKPDEVFIDKIVTQKVKLQSTKVPVVKKKNDSEDFTIIIVILFIIFAIIGLGYAIYTMLTL